MSSSLVPLPESFRLHYDDVIMTRLASQITSLTVVYSIVYSGVNQRKHQSSASLAFVREIHRGPVNFPHKWPVTRKMFPFDDVIMYLVALVALSHCPGALLVSILTSNKTWRTRNAVRSSDGDCEKTTQYFAMMSASDLFVGYICGHRWLVSFSYLCCV